MLCTLQHVSAFFFYYFKPAFCWCAQIKHVFWGSSQAVQCLLLSRWLHLKMLLCFLCPPCGFPEAGIEGKTDPGLYLCIYGCLRSTIFQQTPASTVSHCGYCHFPSWLFREGCWIPQSNQSYYFLFNPSALWSHWIPRPSKRYPLLDETHN